MPVGVVVGTFGDEDEWSYMAHRAQASAMAAGADFILWSHGETLQHARNGGADTVCRKGADWLIFLDADDELDENYVTAMEASMGGDILKPSTLGVYRDGSEDDAPAMIPQRDLDRANHIVIGAMCRASLFWEVGGFRDYPILEDWDLWRRMWKAGAEIVEVPDAIYRVHVREGSRNQDQDLHNRVYNQIRRSR